MLLNVGLKVDGYDLRAEFVLTDPVPDLDESSVPLLCSWSLRELHRLLHFL